MDDYNNRKSAWLRTPEKKYIWIIGSILLLLIAIIDYFTGIEIQLTIFYVIPIFVVSWFIDRKNGVLVSVISVLLLQVSNILAGQRITVYFVYFWNAGMRLILFLIVPFVAYLIRSLLEYKNRISKTDYITATLNSSTFNEIAEKEIHRTRRYEEPFSLIYMDIDNLKNINKYLGHSIGDKLLKVVADTMKENLRVTDVIARLGGDEFAVLLPRTDKDQTRVVCKKIQKLLKKEMQQNQWSVTFSFGVLTCEEAPNTADELIKMGNDLMNVAKNNRNKSIHYSTYVG